MLALDLVVDLLERRELLLKLGEACLSSLESVAYRCATHR